MCRRAGVVAWARMGVDLGVEGFLHSVFMVQGVGVGGAAGKG